MADPATYAGQLQNFSTERKLRDPLDSGHQAVYYFVIDE